MDSLKAVGKAIKNSPRAIRKRLGHADHHEHLEDDWYHSQDPVNAGVTFYVKYLGCTGVTRTHGPGSTDDAVKTIVQHAKSRGGKLQKVMMTISSKYLRLQDVQLQIKLDELPLYRVSYCTVDPYYDKVFCYISRNAETKCLECHAFLCTKRSKAEAITLTVAQAFNIAFERWQAAKKYKLEERARRQREKAEGKGVDEQAKAMKSERNGEPSIGEAISSNPPSGHTSSAAEPISLLPPPPGSHTSSSHSSRFKTPSLAIEVTPTGSPEQTRPFRRRESRDDMHIRTGLLDVRSQIPKAISLDYLQLDDQFDAEFTKLAEARSNPRLPIGDHISQTNMEEDVLGFLQGEKTGQDLSLTQSVDDLLLL